MFAIDFLAAIYFIITAITSFVFGITAGIVLSVLGVALGLFLLYWLAYGTLWLGAYILIRLGWMK